MSSWMRILPGRNQFGRELRVAAGRPGFAARGLVLAGVLFGRFTADDLVEVAFGSSGPRSSNFSNHSSQLIGSSESSPE